ncbi:hypothetical protein CH372_19185 [Leptospira meyeri]|uniref:hypothetical protein n=1 Tax=Leptospira meyeri TaxID=29508 RepID=UPI000C29CCF7|nr:hypothetical protein [Leptospira meyeri]PKA10479.1 hypothetical protein CH372_19185 [Leptospira meyeri]PKA23036.1 hypothetical protein CH381_27910 [Leptospira sp. mixed culture ATI2-C-A1]
MLNKLRILIFLILISLTLIVFLNIKENTKSQEYRILSLPNKISQDCPTINKFIYPSKIKNKENYITSKEITIQCKISKLSLVQEYSHVENTTYLKFDNEIIIIQSMKVDKLGYNQLTILTAIGNIFIITEFNGDLISELLGSPPKEELLFLDWKTGMITRI